MHLRLPVLMAALAALTAPGGAEPAAPLSALARMPVKEITVFKDGHAFVLHQGRMPTDGAGNVLLDSLPTPVLGTFWPYSADKNVSLTSVTASQRRVRVERTALSLPELLEANPGADVTLTDGLSAPGFGPSGTAPSFSAQIVGVPQRSAEESAAISPPSSDEKLPQQGTVILLKTAGGVSVLPLDRFQSITFKGAYKPTLAEEEFRSLLTLRLDWHGRAPAKTADVGMLYLQKGIRWIPSYKITIDGSGGAVVKLQATLINEMTDLTDVTANLVVGVPTFAFQGQADPIGLQQTLAQLSPYFSADADTANGFSNAVMSQAGGFSAYNRNSRAGERVNTNSAGDAAGPGGGDPAALDATKNEDFFIFTVKHVTLGKGQRMVLPVAEYPLKYKDVYTLDLPYTPPLEVRQNYSADQQGQLARLLASPRVMHKLRFVNHSPYPLTTAPALILRSDRVLAQGLMTYTAVNSTVDLDLTTAVDIRVKKTEKVTGRVPSAEKWLGNAYGRVDLAGQISLTNFGARPITIEVTRQVLGTVGTADSGGTAEMLGALEDEDAAPAPDYPVWWGWYGLPPWWSHFNGIGRIRWAVPLAPQKPTDLGYTWSYIWQ